MTTDTGTIRRTALVVVDAQHDFTEGWALPVEGGWNVCHRIAELLHTAGSQFDAVYATYDWHPDDAPFHFVAEGETPDFEDMWPRHCVAGTDGAANPADLDRALDDLGAVRVFKGQQAPAFSGFEAHAAEDGSGPSLADLLDDAAITDVVICGLALDFCVRSTALDAAEWARDRGRTVTVRRDLTAPVHPSRTKAVVDELAAAGIEVTGRSAAAGS